MNLTVSKKVQMFSRILDQKIGSVCDEFTDRQRFVVGSMGPTGYLPVVFEGKF